jgi:hypothetical protein
MTVVVEVNAAAHAFFDRLRWRVFYSLAAPMQRPPAHWRERAPYLLAMLFVIALGLASRKLPGLFPAAVGKYPGDALWALMVFAAYGVLLPYASTYRLAALALMTSYAVELSQLYQAGWIDAIRASTLGHLILGSTFHWPDLAAYTVGVAIGAAVHVLSTKARRQDR